MDAQKIAKWLVLLVLLPILAIVQIVSYVNKQAPPQAAQPVQATKAAEDARAQEYVDLNGRMKKLTKQEITAMVFACKQKIMTFASENQTEKFGVFMPDEYSANVYQAGVNLSGGKILSDKARAEQLKIDLASNTDWVNVFRRASRYTVIHTRDSFNGTVKEPVVYFCEVGNDLSIIPKRGY